MSKNLQFNFSDAVSQWHASRCFSMVLGHFYKKTGKCISILFKCDPQSDNQLSIYLEADKPMTEDELQYLHTLIENFDILNNNMKTLEKLSNYDQTKDLIFKLNEESQHLTQTIFSK